MDVMTMAFAKPKTIKLENYPAIYEAVCSKLLSGGEVTGLDAGTLFKDLKTNRSVKVRFAIPNSTTKVTVTGATIAHPITMTYPTQISMNAIMQTNVLMRVTIIINRDVYDVASVSVIHG